MAEEVARRVENGSAKTRLVPNYVDTDRFRPGREEARPEFELIYIGRLSAQKNLKVLLEAIRPLDCRLKMIGDGELGEELKRDFQDLRGRVEWIPRVANDELPGHLRKASIFCLPSRFEGHPKALIEAMAAGLGVVGADVPGIREVIQDGVTGLLSPAEPWAFGQAIQRLLDDQGLRDGLGRAARDFAVANYNLDRVADLEAEIYRDLEVQAPHGPA
jgi:glycosyltransferase involved in cell wall biosynthesis